MYKGVQKRGEIYDDYYKNNPVKSSYAVGKLIGKSENPRGRAKVQEEIREVIASAEINV